MANGNTQEWIAKLQDTLTHLQMSSVSVEQKLDQVKDSVDKLESSVADMKSAAAGQETRLALLEEKCKTFRNEIPDNLSEQLVLIRSQLKTYSRFLWIVVGSVVALAFKMISVTW
jgi:predicted  nucleic acid-binding Zn-ribbon protein